MDSKKLAVYKDLINKKFIVMLYWTEEDIQDAVKNYCIENNVPIKAMREFYTIDAPDGFILTL